jgi:hypothetical protein
MLHIVKWIKLLQENVFLNNIDVLVIFDIFLE